MILVTVIGLCAFKYLLYLFKEFRLRHVQISGNVPTQVHHGNYRFVAL